MGRFGINACCVLLVVFSFGCAGTKAISQADRERVKKISIAHQNVTLGNEDGESILYFSTPGGNWAGVGGLAGLAIYSAVKDRGYEATVWDNLQKDNMAKKAVADAFAYQFCGTTFQCVPPGEADAKLHIKVNNIMVTPKIGGNIGAELVDGKTGETLWKGVEFYSNNKRQVQYPYEDYASKPERLREGVSVLAQMVAKSLVEEFGGLGQPIKNELTATARE